MSERYESWSTADHDYSLEHAEQLRMLGAAAGGRSEHANVVRPGKRKVRSLELRQLLYGALELRRLPGSGAEQAPEVLAMLTAAGLRAVHQESPPGVAVFTDSEPPQSIDTLSTEHALLWIMCGLDMAQSSLEDQFANVERRTFLCRRFASRLQELRPRMQLDEHIAPLLSAEPATEEAMEGLIDHTIRRVAEPMGASLHQLEREWARLSAANCTLANACLSRFCASSGVHMQDATLMVSAHASRVRMLLLLYDRVVHEAQQWPRPFSWVPCLRLALEMQSADELARAMTTRLWQELHIGMP